MQPSRTEVRHGNSAPHPYQTSDVGVPSTGPRTADPLTRGAEFLGSSYRDGDSGKSGVDVGDISYRQLDHTTSGREVVMSPYLGFCLHIVSYAHRSRQSQLILSTSPEADKWRLSGIKWNYRGITSLYKCTTPCSVVRRCFYHMRQLITVRKTLTTDSVKTLVQCSCSHRNSVRLL